MKNAKHVVMYLELGLSLIQSARLQITGFKTIKAKGNKNHNLFKAAIVSGQYDRDVHDALILAPNAKTIRRSCKAVCAVNQGIKISKEKKSKQA